MDIAKKIQTILTILSEHELQIAIILFLIMILKVLLNIFILDNSKENIKNHNKKEKWIFRISEG